MFTTIFHVTSRSRPDVLMSLEVGPFFFFRNAYHDHVLSKIDSSHADVNYVADVASGDEVGACRAFHNSLPKL